MNLRKLYYILFSTICIGSGVAFILIANIGSNSITVIQDGVHEILHVTYGQAALLYNSIMIIVARIFARNFFGIGTVISALLTGVVIDLTHTIILMFLSLVNFNDLFIIIVCFVCGQILYAYGLFLLISCNLGMNSLDSLATLISMKTNSPYKYLRLLLDLLLVFIGWILGGVIGIGTIFTILFTGLLVDYFIRMSSLMHLKSISKLDNDNYFRG